ncbi:transcriptional regulator [Calothrix sp. NIES-4071]|nr:transcriptional regulator [Calothrix sp. NIES-4071]BAZ61531.1 transcriptional regulator [Calothrix sp. NIES-4105]
MLKKTVTIDDSVSIRLPEEIVKALGLNPGSEVELEVVGNTLVIRPETEIKRSTQFLETFQSVLEKRKSAYEELAKGESS